MASNSSTTFFHPTPLGMRSHSSVDQFFQQVSALFLQVLDSPVFNSMPFTPANPIATAFPAKTHITPVGLTSLLFGVASSLMLLGSVVFMVGFMMMPFVAFLGSVVFVGALLANFSMPGLGQWRRGFSRWNSTGLKHKL